MDNPRTRSNRPLPTRHASRGPLVIRISYIALMLVTIAVGLLTRKAPDLFPPLISLHGGDALWAMTVYFLIRAVGPDSPIIPAAIVALAICFAIELSQVYHAPWIDSMRQTTVGALLLGQGFLWSDLICYAAGIFIGAALDLVASRLRR